YPTPPCRSRQRSPSPLAGEGRVRAAPPRLVRSGEKYSSCGWVGREQTQSLAVFLRGLDQHIERQRGSGGRFVPLLRLQPITHVLLVEARRIASRTILLDGPETRGVRRQRLVDQIELAGGVGAKLELGVRDDDAARPSIVGRRRVQR